MSHNNVIVLNLVTAKKKSYEDINTIRRKYLDSIYKETTRRIFRGESFAVLILNAQSNCKHAFLYQSSEWRKEAIALSAMFCPNWKITFLPIETRNQNINHISQAPGNTMYITG